MNAMTQGKIFLELRLVLHLLMKSESIAKIIQIG